MHNKDWGGEGDGPALPSVSYARGHREYRYYEVLRFSGTVIDNFRWVCATTGRHIGVSRDWEWKEPKSERKDKDRDVKPKEVDRFLEEAVVRRKCGVWSRRLDDGGLGHSGHL